MSTYRITEASPALFIILIDQSYSMSEYHAKDRRSTNAEIAADAANRMIFSLGLHSLSSSSKTQQIKDKFEVSVIGYGGMGEDAMAVSAFQGNLEGRWAVRISEIFENSIDEDREGSPVWITPKSDGTTPMVEAVDTAVDISEDWVSAHLDCHPPVILNISDGGACDMYGRRTPEVEDRFLDSVEALKSVETNHGSTLFINHFLSPVDSKDALYPTSFYSKDDFGDLLFNSSSMLTEEMCMFAKTKGYHDIKPGKSRGFIQNGDSKDIIDFLQIGTLGTVPTNAKKDVLKK